MSESLLCVAEASWNTEPFDPSTAELLAEAIAWAVGIFDALIGAERIGLKILTALPAFALFALLIDAEGVVFPDRFACAVDFVRFREVACLAEVARAGGEEHGRSDQEKSDESM